MKQLTYLIAILLTFTSCESLEKKKEEFSFLNHLKSNQWCSFKDDVQRCFIFSDSKLTVQGNGIDEGSAKVNFNQISDSIVVIKVVGEQGIENHFRMKSLNTVYFSQIGLDQNPDELTRVE